MSDSPIPICFNCGQPAIGPRLNRLEDGVPCPTCADRLLMLLPPLLPGAIADPTGLPSGEDLTNEGPYPA